MLTELMKRSESLSPVILFIMLEVSLSISLIGSFFLESESLLYIFCLGKLGVIPLWFWVFRLFNGLDFRSLFSIMSIYKIIPLSMTFFFLTGSFTMSLICFNSLVILYLFFGMNSLANFLATMVVFSTGWLMSSSVSSGLTIVVFFLFYLIMLSFLLFSENGQPNLFTLLFYSGLPPLGSFFGKLFVFLSSASSWGLLFIPLFGGLMVVTVWLFLSISSSKSSWSLISLMLLLGVFV